MPGVMVAAPRLALLADDPTLDALGDAWSPAGGLELFNGMVLPHVWPDRKAAAVTVEDVSYTPGRPCTVLYAVTFCDDAPVRRAVATFAKDDRLTGVFAEHYRGDHGRVAGD